ncbi:MAG: hypothetical protein IKV87_01975 [Methanobrevibacter sp.]|nr:hypothetical protein [Methanobrevibacter sp.]
MKRIAKGLIQDKKGLLYSTELILSLILLLFVIGIMANITDTMNEKILSEEELSALEAISVESADYLLSNPGNPIDWEDDEGLNRGIVSRRIISGLAINGKAVENGFFYDESTESEETILNTISFKKLNKLKGNYDDLINRNLFNSSFKSSITVYPMNSNMDTIAMGDDLDDYDGDVVAVKRTVMCDFYSDFVLYRFNDFKLYGEDYKKTEECNHDTNPDLLNHDNDRRSFWLCKSFRVYKSSLENYNYYLISAPSIKNTNSYYILESLNRTRDDKERINHEIIDLNPFFTQDLENSSNEIYSIHFNVEKEDIGDFKTVLVAIPKNMTDEMASNNQLNYDYFNSGEVDFVLKTAYK